MKVDRKKFNECIEYLRSIEKEKLEDLDLSEFFDIDETEYRFLIHKWNLVGLNNRDFILGYTYLWKK